jgi:hypothetical protein
VSKQVRVGTGQYFTWMKGFITLKGKKKEKKNIGVNLLLATVSQ